LDPDEGRDYGRPMPTGALHSTFLITYEPQQGQKEHLAWETILKLSRDNR